MARARQYADQVNVAKDLRDKACRDVRQTVAIAYNDTRKLTEQLTYLDQHQLSTEKARDAYRKQFDIGQRTLLDLLDTENELFQAKRAYTNADYDLLIAQVRTQAGFGNLLATLDLSRVGQGRTARSGRLEGRQATVAERCPPEGAGALCGGQERARTRGRRNTCVKRLGTGGRPAPAAQLPPVAGRQLPNVTLPLRSRTGRTPGRAAMCRLTWTATPTASRRRMAQSRGLGGQAQAGDRRGRRYPARHRRHQGGDEGSRAMR